MKIVIKSFFFFVYREEERNEKKKKRKWQPEGNIWPIEDLGKIFVLKKINITLYNIYYLIFCDVFIPLLLLLLLFFFFFLIVLVFKLIACPRNFAFFAVLFFDKKKSILLLFIYIKSIHVKNQLFIMIYFIYRLVKKFLVRSF